MVGACLKGVRKREVREGRREGGRDGGGGWRERENQNHRQNHFGQVVNLK